MSEELDDLAHAASGASNRNAPEVNHRGPVERLPAPPTAADPIAVGFRTALGAAPPLFLVIVFAILAAAWIIKETIKADLQDTSTHSTAR